MVEQRVTYQGGWAHPPAERFRRRSAVRLIIVVDRLEEELGWLLLDREAGTGDQPAIEAKRLELEQAEAELAAIRAAAEARS